jgi:hypothetical protein
LSGSRLGWLRPRLKWQMAGRMKACHEFPVKPFDGNLSFFGTYLLNITGFLHILS